MNARFRLGADVLKLFARLRKLSTKLPPIRAGKPRERPQPLAGAADFESTSPQSIEPDRSGTSVLGASADISTNLYPTSPQPHLPLAAEISDSVTPITPDLQTSSKSATEPKAKSPLLRAVGKTVLAVGSSLGGVGSILAKPFQGAKPLHKNKLFWAGSGLTLGLSALAGAWVFVDQSVNQYAPADALSYLRPGTITIKGVNGTILLQTGNATRETLKTWQMPDKLKKAFVAIEDRRFYEHDGVDYKGVTRAVVQNITSKNLVEGASSINQQLARMVYLNQERSMWRKLREVRIAQKLTQGLTKDQILERYLNLVYLGEGTYGVADSAWVYFSKTVDQLSLAEMATLAAMPPAPNRYSPFVNPRFAEQRRNLVLDRMVDLSLHLRQVKLKPNRSNPNAAR
jgi:penicillin-binding protein 1A